MEQNNIIDITKVRECLQYLKSINSMKLEDVSFVEKNNPSHKAVDFCKDQEDFNDWEFVGLSNIDFIKIYVLEDLENYGNCNMKDFK